MSQQWRRSIAVLGLRCACVLLIGVAGCRREAPQEPIDVDAALVSANTDFAFDLFVELISPDGPTENVFISPSSIAMALAMTRNGARGATLDAMSEALAVGSMTQEALNQSNADLLASLQQSQPAVELTIANSLWAREGVPFIPEFLAANDEFYGAKVSELDFDDPAAVKTINDWVREQTEGKIHGIVQAPIHAATTLFLINAVYFNGSWADQFDPRFTQQARFVMLDGSEKTVNMMYRDGAWPYYHGEGFQAISLPYRGGRITMHIFLPDPTSSLAEFCARLTTENLGAWLQQLKEKAGYIGLPRFSAEYEAVLNDALSALGMAIAFDPDLADFRNMRDTPHELWIREVRHKTLVEVNERGTEAAAATDVEMVEGMEEDALQMIVDRPFFCAIRDSHTGAIVFMGAIVDPQ